MSRRTARGSRARGTAPRRSGAHRSAARLRGRDGEVVGEQGTDERDPLEELLRRLLPGQEATHARDVVRLEGAEARRRERGADELAEAFAAKVVVPADERHLDVQARVRAVRLEDQGRSSGTQDAPV